MVEHGDLTGVTSNPTIFEKLSMADTVTIRASAGLSLPSLNSVPMSCTSE